MGLTYVTSVFIQYNLRIWGASTVGLIAGVIIGVTSDYFTSEDKAPVQKTAEAAQTGAAINIITGFSYGLRSVLPPLVGIAGAAVVAYRLCEPLGTQYALYGISMAALGMLSIVGLVVSNDAYGPIVDNSKGIAEQGGLGEEVINVTDELDAAGNTAKAITKGFAIGAAGLTVIALFSCIPRNNQKRNRHNSQLRPDEPTRSVRRLYRNCHTRCFFSDAYAWSWKKRFQND